MRPPDDPLGWILDQEELKEQIRKAEALTNALRDYLCCELEQKLRYPLPFSEPTPEDLYQAESRLEQTRAALLRVDTMKQQQDPGWEVAQTLLPQIKDRIAEQEKYLAIIQKRLDYCGKPFNASPGRADLLSTEPADPTEANA